MSKAGEIIEGWTNLLFKNGGVEAVAARRMEICKVCPYNSKFHKTNKLYEHCTDCGCPLSTKTRSMKTSCPQGKWGPVKRE